MRIKRVTKSLEGEIYEGRSPFQRWLVFAVSLFALIAVQSNFVRSAELPQGEFKARLNGLELWYLVSGKGPVCIMPSTGWGPSTDIYFRAFGPLEEVFTMVYLDSRGTGRSEKPDSTTEYTYDHFVQDMDALRQYLGSDQVWLMGQSEGGVQIQHYAIAHPQHVAGLILLATLPASDADWVADVRKGIATHKGAPYYEAGVKTMEAMFSADERGWKGFALDESFLEKWQLTFPFYFSDFERFQQLAPEMNQQASHSDIAPPAEAFAVDALKGTNDSGRHPFNLIPRLQELDTPALIVVGVDDIFCPLSTAERLHLALRHSKLLVIEKAGHFPWLEQPDRFFSGIKSFLPPLGYTPD